MFWGLASKGWTAVDAGDDNVLRAVSVSGDPSSDERPRVLAAAEVPVEPGAELAPVLRELMNRMTRRLPTVVTLPRSDYSLRVMPEPSVPSREMTNSLRWTLTLESDSTGDDLNVAWLRIPTAEDMPGRPQQVYAVSTPKTSLAARLASWKPGGLRPKAVDIRETALRNIALRLEQPNEGLALMAADARGLSIVFTHKGALYLDRYIQQSEDEVQQADAVMRQRLYERVAQQLARSVEVVNRSYPFMTVSRVVCAPMPGRPGCLEWLSANAGIRVEPLNIPELFDLQAVPEMAGSLALQSRCLVALGAALRSTRSSA